MRIAQIAPLIEDVPPRLYGGTERVVSYLTEELVALGHDVTLFASGSSVTAAELVACVPQSLRFDPKFRDWVPYYMAMLDMVRERSADFDILHFHIDALHFPWVSTLAAESLTTLHGRLDLYDLQHLYRAFPHLPLVSISNDQRRPIGYANFVATVPHGLPARLLQPSWGKVGGYLAFLGRISPEKRPDRAIEIARRCGLTLRIAAKIDRFDEAYFRNTIAPLLGPDIEFVGEIDDREKQRFLGEAAALLFPIDWPEPFGLTMIEAMACGTPVLAFRCGSVPEVIDDGVTGIIVDTLEEAAAAMPRVLGLDRARIRRVFDERFTSRRMALQYLEIYERLARARSTGSRRSVQAVA